MIYYSRARAEAQPRADGVLNHTRNRVLFGQPSNPSCETSEHTVGCPELGLANRRCNGAVDTRLKRLIRLVSPRRRAEFSVRVVTSLTPEALLLSLETTDLARLKLQRQSLCCSCAIEGSQWSHCRWSANNEARAVRSHAPRT